MCTPRSLVVFHCIELTALHIVMEFNVSTFNVHGHTLLNIEVHLLVVSPFTELA